MKLKQKNDVTEENEKLTQKNWCDKLIPRCKILARKFIATKRVAPKFIYKDATICIPTKLL